MTRENKSDSFVKFKYKQILRIKNDPVKSTEICLPACDSAYVSVLRFKLTLDLFGWWSSCDKQAKRFPAVLNIRSRQKKCAWKNGFVFEVRKGKSNNLNRSWHYIVCVPGLVSSSMIIPMVIGHGQVSTYFMLRLEYTIRSGAFAPSISWWLTFHTHSNGNVLPAVSWQCYQPNNYPSGHQKLIPFPGLSVTLMFLCSRFNCYESS